MKKQLRHDILALLSYNEDEEDDFREHLLSEDYITENKIITEEEMQVLYDNDADDIEEVGQIIMKAARHPGINHIYAVMQRISDNI